MRVDLKSFLPSVLRTLVPLVVGYFTAFPVAQWLNLSDDQVTSLVTVVITAVYYLVVRVAERYAPEAGWLLGWASPPVYVPPKDAGFSATPVDDVRRVVNR